MKTLVLGAARSGVAAANFLAARGESVVLADRNAYPQLPSAVDDRVVRAFGREDAALLDDVGLVVLSPGVPTTIPLLREAAVQAIPVIGEIELAYRHLKGTVIAITGSNGKSTTTSLVGEILKAAGREPIVAGNIGHPLIAMIDPEKPRTYVIELSSFQLETVDTFRANVALLLNITPDHMDRYPSFAAYAAAKYRIFRNQQADDTAIVNLSEHLDAQRDTKSRLWRFSATPYAEPGAWLDGVTLASSVEGDERRIPRASLRLQGMANVENALAAWLAARAVGVNDDVCVHTAFSTFAGLPHRMVLVRELNGVRWINDSKGTNVGSTVAALAGLAGEGSKVVLIAGGEGKGQDFSPLKDAVTHSARALVLIGRDAPLIEAAVAGTGIAVRRASSMEEAVALAAQAAQPGDAVLLSPACASFDMFRDYAHRGEVFRLAVEKITHAASH